MRKVLLTALTAAVVAAVAFIPQTASAAKPKPYGFYGGKWVTLQADQTGKQLSSFDGYCTASRKSPYSFSVFWGIPVKSSGKFKWSKPNAVNTPDGGTLTQQSKVTIKGKFTSKTKVSGTYQLHKGGCKKIKFKAKLQRGG